MLPRDRALTALVGLLVIAAAPLVGGAAGTGLVVLGLLIAIFSLRG
jgi:hypothetical protein